MSWQTMKIVGMGLKDAGRMIVQNPTDLCLHCLLKPIPVLKTYLVYVVISFIIEAV